MAMMMTGRVLLVCALCVLWCGAGGVHAEDDAGVTSPGASASDGKSFQEPPTIVNGGSHNSVLRASDVNEQTDETDKEVLLTKEVAGSDEDEVPQTSAEEIPPPSASPKKSKGGGGTQQEDDLDLKRVNEIVLQPEKQRREEEGLETVGDGEAAVTKLNEGSGPQPQDNPHPVQEEDTKSGEGHELTQGKDQQIKVEAKTPSNPAGDHSSGEHNGNDGSNEREGGEEKDDERHRAQEREEAAHVSGAPKVNSTDIQQEVQHKNAGETPTGIKQRAGEEKDDETEEEREKQKEQHQENPPGKEKETITGANTINQINTTPGDSDGSTAVYHTTSPLLLLLVVACAAAAVVAA
ncbi:Mucin-associated surface protein (MASP) [Trypanosoma cruzi]|uniref:Mucin-associated surface protein (MASP), putative n=2 Tax=Trypanosoma cruzi TaxID=5693 RepID=Q4E493_TRYCC|nr:mucin-associated surface protein (MASP), putative [Trypanosoma cruzi]EAN99580.1 mucin-associated surface protein (MASP), putative [Trypanosoma cruzi]KAF8291914.1 Mucin-associated surface protein (MASP), subgroup S048 [Trypanosoma cruzi]PWV17087.1 Mucin-associated surface protein (MASP) [Trypanosoma cruzi]|eukprot:XP_821431.1 mucin-associated surface protein (MASP) [Trypanosoma cruzi strain CL Brener]